MFTRIQNPLERDPKIRLMKKFEQEIEWNTVRNAFFSTYASSGVLETLDRYGWTLGQFFTVLRERGRCIAQRLDVRHSLWMLPNVTDSNPAAFCVLIRLEAPPARPVHLLELRPAYTIDGQGRLQGAFFECGRVWLHDIPISRTLDPGFRPPEGSGIVARGGFKVAPFHIAQHLMGNGLPVSPAIIDSLEWQAQRGAQSIAAKKLERMRMSRPVVLVDIMGRWRPDERLYQSSPLLSRMLPGVSLDEMEELPNDFWRSLLGRWFARAFGAQPGTEIGAKIVMREFPGMLEGFYAIPRTVEKVLPPQGFGLLSGSFPSSKIL